MSEGKKALKTDERKKSNLKDKPFKQKSQGTLAIRLVNPQTIPWGIGLLIAYILMVFITGSWQEGFVAQIIASIRLLILTLGIFYTFLGILGIIYHPEDKNKAIPQWVRNKIFSKK